MIFGLDRFLVQMYDWLNMEVVCVDDLDLYDSAMFWFWSTACVGAHFEASTGFFVVSPENWSSPGAVTLWTYLGVPRLAGVFAAASANLA